MPVSVTKNPGQGNAPFFSSGSISFSELRNKFTDDQPGFGQQISASQLRRNTDVSIENPIVPDSTENEQISTSNNLKLSQFRNSIKRYLATQSGTDDNSSYPGEPGFRMGLYASNGRGIDWSGGGVNGRDGQGGNNTGNHIKNVQKGVLITGTCGSVQAGIPAAQVAPRLTVHNMRIDVSGSILGYGGAGGTVQDGNAEDGAVALNLGTLGKNNRVIVGSGARIYGGGGGGEKGYKGANGANGRCRDVINRSNCGGCPGCPGGYSSSGCRRGGGCRRKQVCNWWGNCWRETDAWDHFETCTKVYDTAGGIGGDGGNGGRGRGYNNQGGPSGGSGGNAGTPGQGCFAGGGPDPAAEAGKTGGTGGTGGDWGQRGEETSGPGNPGNGGAAINRSSGEGYDLYGTVNNNTIRGAINR